MRSRQCCLALLLAPAVIATVAASTRLVAQQAGEQPVINNPATAKFVSFPNAAECTKGAVERGDPSNGPSVILGKFAPGCAVPWHWHTPNEQVLAVSGALQIQMKDGKPVLLRPGGFALAPSHHVHRAKCTGSATCVFFLSSDAAFDIHYVNETGQEIQLDAALKAANKGTARSKVQ